MYRGQPWHEAAACNGMDLDVFFPPRHRTGGNMRVSSAEHEAKVHEAKSVCAVCPVAAQCLEEALSYPMREDAGIRGGLTVAERNKLRKASA